MKLPHLLTICLLPLGLAAARAQEIKINVPGQPSAPATAAPAAPSFSEAQMAEELGWFMAKRAGLTELEFGKPEVDAFLKGVTAAANGKDSPFELEKIGPSMDEFMQKKNAAYGAKLKAKSTAEAAAFFAKLKDNKNVIELPSGLRYEIVKQGEGAFPKPTDTVTAHYTGALVDGTVFDSSVQRGKPEEFPLDGVIPGWTEGIQKINKGGKIKLYVPSQLGYGDQGNQGIPPGATLVFDVELLDFKPTPAAPALPAGLPVGK